MIGEMDIGEIGRMLIVDFDDSNLSKLIMHLDQTHILLQFV